MLAKALSRGADAVIIDFEDAVAHVRKEEARTLVAAWLSTVSGDAGSEVWVRVNSRPEFLADDLEALAGAAAALTGVFVPKLEQAATLDQLNRQLASGLRVVCMLESAAGILGASGLATGPRVSGLAIGEADLCAELGIDPSPDEQELLCYRMIVVAASAAAGLDPPIGPVSTDFRDLDAVRESTVRLRRMGFGARFAIHPGQIAPIHAAFTPSAEQVERATRLIKAATDAAGAGQGVFIDQEGRMIDEAVLRGARRVLELADKGGFTG
jgi:citrate lyase subunit beta/citryl-CoA lyase